MVAAVAGSALMLRGQLDAVHAGHVQVDDAEVERRCRSAAAVAASSTARSRRAASTDCDAPGAELLAQDLAVGGVVVDDQRALPRAGRHRSRALSERGRRVRTRSDSSNQNVLPSAGALVEPESAAHQLDELLGRSPGRGRCRRTLRVVDESAWEKGWNSRSLVVRCDADAGVGDLEAQGARVSVFCAAPADADARPRPAR